MLENMTTDWLKVNKHPLKQNTYVLKCDIFRQLWTISANYMKKPWLFIKVDKITFKWLLNGNDKCYRCVAADHGRPFRWWVALRFSLNSLNVAASWMRFVIALVEWLYVSFCWHSRYTTLLWLFSYIKILPDWADFPSSRHLFVPQVSLFSPAGVCRKGGGAVACSGG